MTGSIHETGTTDVVPYDKEKLAVYYNGDVNDVSENEFKELLGREIPIGDIVFYKKNRVIVDYFTTVDQLRQILLLGN